MNEIVPFITKHKWVAIAALIVGLLLGWYLFIRKRVSASTVGQSLVPYTEPPVYGSSAYTVTGDQTTLPPTVSAGTASTTADAPQSVATVPVSAAVNNTPWPGTNLISPGSTSSLPVYATPFGPAITPYGNPTSQPFGFGQQQQTFIPPEQINNVVSNNYPGSVPFDPRLAAPVPMLFPGFSSVADEAQHINGNPDVFQNYINISGAIASATAFAQAHNGSAQFVAAGQPIKYLDSNGNVVDPATWQVVGHP